MFNLLIHLEIKYFLEKRDTSFMTEYYNTPGTQSGSSKILCQLGCKLLACSTYTRQYLLITLAYTKQPDSITASPGDTQGTYVSNKYQDLLLYACLVEAYGYLKGPADMLQYYEQSYSKAATHRTLSNNKVEDAETNIKMVLFVRL
jgi:hypothetical protein